MECDSCLQWGLGCGVWVSSTGLCIVIVVLAFGAVHILFPTSLLLVSLFFTSEAHWGFSPVFCAIGVSQYRVMVTCHHCRGCQLVTAQVHVSCIISCCILAACHHCEFGVYWASPLKIMSICLCINAAGLCCFEDGADDGC